MMHPRAESWRSPLVLVVEDEPLLAMELETLLAANGMRVLGPAKSVEEASDLLEHETPDVAVLDVNVSDKLVTPIAEALRAGGVPFVVASASDPRRLGIDALTKVPYCAKPIDANRLLEVLGRLLLERPIGLLALSIK